MNAQPGRKPTGNHATEATTVTTKPPNKKLTYAQMAAKPPNNHKQQPVNNVDKTPNEYIQTMYHNEMTKIQAKHHWMGTPGKNTDQKTTMRTQESGED
eukprot:243442-Prorocentrum_lima.AAC.1